MKTLAPQEPKPEWDTPEWRSAKRRDARHDLLGEILNVAESLDSGDYVLLLAHALSLRLAAFPHYGVHAPTTTTHRKATP